MKDKGPVEVYKTRKLDHKGKIEDWKYKVSAPNRDIDDTITGKLEELANNISKSFKTQGEGIVIVSKCPNMRDPQVGNNPHIGLYLNYAQQYAELSPDELIELCKKVAEIKKDYLDLK